MSLQTWLSPSFFRYFTRLSVSSAVGSLFGSLTVPTFTPQYSKAFLKKAMLGPCTHMFSTLWQDVWHSWAFSSSRLLKARYMSKNGSGRGEELREMMPQAPVNRATRTRWSHPISTVRLSFAIERQYWIRYISGWLVFKHTIGSMVSINFRDKAALRSFAVDWAMS